MILSTQSPRPRRGPSLLLTMLLATGCSAPLVRDIPMLSPEDPHFDIKHMYAVPGVEFNLYHDIPWYNPMRWRDLADVENRTHRKILVVDGKVGFTGGVGIADIWTGNAESP